MRVAERSSRSRSSASSALKSVSGVRRQIQLAQARQHRQRCDRVDERVGERECFEACGQYARRGRRQRLLRQVQLGQRSEPGQRRPLRELAVVEPQHAQRGERAHIRCRGMGPVGHAQRTHVPGIDPHRSPVHFGFEQAAVVAAKRVHRPHLEAAIVRDLLQCLALRRRQRRQRVRDVGHRLGQPRPREQPGQAQQQQQRRALHPLPQPRTHVHPVRFARSSTATQDGADADQPDRRAAAGSFRAWRQPARCRRAAWRP